MSGCGGVADHCPACRVARELAEHRDVTAVGWSIRRGTLSFAVIVARRACPDYEPSGRAGGGEETHLVTGLGVGRQEGRVTGL